MTQYKITYYIKQGTTTSELRFAENSRDCRREFLQDNYGMNNSDIVSVKKTGVIK